MLDPLRQAKLNACRTIGRRLSRGPRATRHGPRATDHGFDESSLNELQWKKLLAFLDENGLTLLFRRRVARDVLPAWVQARLDANFSNSQGRFASVLEQQRKIAQALADAGVSATVLKGVPVALETYPEPWDRVQYDFDFLVSAEQQQLAVDACAQLGYRLEADQTSDHTCMTPAHRYRWRGDFFDPLIPLKIELHARLWDPRYQIDLQGLLSEPEIIPNRETRLGPLSVLSPADHFLFVNLHFFRHLIQNQVRLSHLYEIAVLLLEQGPWQSVAAKICERRVARQILTVNCQLASRLFGLSTDAHPFGAERPELSAGVRSWLERDAVADLLCRFSGNKNYVAVHMDFSVSRWKVLKGALSVHRLPAPARAHYEMQHSPVRGLRLQYLAYALKKAWEHTRGYARLTLRSIGRGRRTTDN